VKRTHAKYSNRGEGGEAPGLFRLRGKRGESERIIMGGTGRGGRGEQEI